MRHWSATNAQEIKDKVLKEEVQMPFDFKTFGDKPKKDATLISMHGGGNARRK
jgi:hypothetical protein